MFKNDIFTGQLSFMSEKKMTFNLFTTDGCHLCEQAIGLFYYAKQQQLIANDTTLKMIDIVDDDKLAERYGVSIPVLQHQVSKQELNWPFDLDGLVDFINQDNLD